MVHLSPKLFRVTHFGVYTYSSCNWVGRKSSHCQRDTLVRLFCACVGIVHRMIGSITLIFSHITHRSPRMQVNWIGKSSNARNRNSCWRTSFSRSCTLISTLSQYPFMIQSFLSLYSPSLRISHRSSSGHILHWCNTDKAFNSGFWGAGYTLSIHLVANLCTFLILSKSRNWLERMAWNWKRQLFLPVWMWELKAVASHGPMVSFLLCSLQ